MYPQDFIERFHSKIDKRGEDECWNWTASLAGKGYGQIKAPIGYGRVNLYAHRVAFMLTRGAVPDGLEVCHHCDNPKCCNPKHLFAGTRSANAQDMSMKMRSTWGTRSGTAKLSEDGVRKVRELLAAGMPQKRIGEIVGVSQIQVSRIKTGKRWNKLA